MAASADRGRPDASVGESADEKTGATVVVGGGVEGQNVKVMQPVVGSTIEDFEVEVPEFYMWRRANLYADAPLISLAFCGHEEAVLDQVKTIGDEIRLGPKTR